jgi:hypothetical protein
MGWFTNVSSASARLRVNASAVIGL